MHTAVGQNASNNNKRQLKELGMHVLLTTNDRRVNTQHKNHVEHYYYQKL